MKVQLVNLNGKNDSNFVVETVNKFSSPKSFDMFDVNIIDLRSPYIYQNKESNDYRIIYNNDFLSINKNQITLNPIKVAGCLYLKWFLIRAIYYFYM